MSAASSDEDAKAGEIGDAIERCAVSEPDQSAIALAASIRGRDPLVDADLRLSGLGLAHQTFLMSALPSRPVGRRSMTAIRIANTSKSENVDDT